MSKTAEAFYLLGQKARSIINHPGGRNAQSPLPPATPQVETRGDGKLRYRSNAFFENFVTYNYEMILGGIKVACGLSNVDGYGPLYGKAYTVDVKAYDVTDAWVLDDQMPVKCPAYNP